MQRKLTRRELAAFLTENGYKISANTWTASADQHAIKGRHAPAVGVLVTCTIRNNA